MASPSTPVDWILNQSHQHPLLSAEQEIILSRYIQEWLPLRDKARPTKRERAIIRRGKRAYDQYFLSNIRLVVHIAGRYKSRSITGSLDLEDLIQEGLVGLERAIVKFDPTRGYKFSTYAFNWVRQAINRSISSKSRTIRLPDHGSALIKKACDFMGEQQRLHGRIPPLTLVAEHCQVGVETLKGYLPYTAGIVSLDDRCRLDGRNDTSTLLEMIADTTEATINEWDEYSERLSAAVDALPPLEQAILRCRYLNQGGSFTALAAQHGVSRHTVTERHRSVLRQLRLQLSPAAPAGTPALQCAA